MEGWGTFSIKVREQLLGGIAHHLVLGLTEGLQDQALSRSRYQEFSHELVNRRPSSICNRHAHSFPLLCAKPEPSPLAAGGQDPGFSFPKAEPQPLLVLNHLPGGWWLPPSGNRGPQPPRQVDPAVSQ